MTKQVTVGENSTITLSLSTFVWSVGIIVSVLSTGIGFAWNSVNNRMDSDKVEYAKKFENTKKELEKEKELRADLEKMFNQYIIKIHRDVGILMERTANGTRNPINTNAVEVHAQRVDSGVTTIPNVEPDQ